ncbi:FAD-binding oxidoreductase [Micromonospora sp. ATCC 39149]|uniref:FAD-binding oxidoreductase n=1 Tax=Micromonospora carbonacea TaxID=47853 RepID=A0A7D6CF34_9ACTN|nr:FAD-binding oxidoreductase [Micromonospora sp. ATCC 39149]QLJ98888.1 FAD-binding oxidoreductase [Micromonospora carbonacea]
MAAAAWSIDRSRAVGITRRLAEICGPPFARLGGAADEVAGEPARWVAVPGAEQAAAEVLRLAAAHDLTVVPRGAGTKIDWGAAPDHVDIMLDTGRLAGICHRPPDAGVAEIGAGTPLRAVQATLERSGLRLALDAPSPGATVGGVLAADESGPLRHRHGSPCEQLVGVRYLAASGELISAGGGAPGLELARLLCGSQGGLGVLVSATLRVQPVPASRAWVTRPVWSPLEVDGLVREVLAARLDPAAVELDLPARANRVRPPLHPDAPEALARARHPSMFRRTVVPAGAGSLTVLLEGGPVDVAERADGLCGLLGDEATIDHSAPQWWRRYPFGLGETALRIEVPITDLHAAVYALRDAAGGPVPVRGSAGQGVLHAALPGSLPAERVASIVAGVRAVLLARRGRCVVVAAPPAVRESVDLWGELTSLPRLRAAKEYLDPHQRLAPGRLPGGL